MLTVEEINKTLDERSQELQDCAETFCKALREFHEFEIGEIETDEDKANLPMLMMEMDRRKAIILRRVLIEHGNLLFL